MIDNATVFARLRVRSLRALHFRLLIFVDAVEEGCAMTMEQAIAYALENHE